MPPFKVYGRILKWPTRGDCKSPGATLHRFESCSYHHLFKAKVLHEHFCKYQSFSRLKNNHTGYFGLKSKSCVELY